MVLIIACGSSSLFELYKSNMLDFFLLAHPLAYWGDILINEDGNVRSLHES